MQTYHPNNRLLHPAARWGTLALVMTFSSAGSANESPSSVTDRARDIFERSRVQGGLIVHLGCGDGTLTTALCRNSAYVVHGLDANADAVGKARAHIHAQGFSGQVSAERFDGRRLPFVDNLVNLLVVSGEGDLSREEMIRVLAPDGVMISVPPSSFISQPYRKPRPRTMGEWTHYQFAAHNNSVGTDQLIGPPRHFQWSGGPLWSTAHENMASLNAMVSAGGRVFYIMDEGPRASSLLPADWQLVARDAFNGVILWKQPIKNWLTRHWPWKSGPAQMPRKLVAVGDKVYAPLDINGPLLQLDAATGKVLQTYDSTAAAEEVVCANGVLLVMTNPTPPDQQAIAEERRRRRHFNYDGRIRVVLDHGVQRKIVAVQADTGEILWQHDGPKVLPLTLASDGRLAVYHNGTSIVAHNLKNGRKLWSSEPITGNLRMFSEESPTLVLYDDVVLFAWNRKLTALSKTDGKTLWDCPWTQADYRSPVSVMVLGDKVWSMDILPAKSPGTFIGRDPRTGEEHSRFDLPPFRGIGHHRCYKAKGTGDFVLLSRSGVEYVDPFKQTYQEHHWVRGACLYGILPCNGLLYATPHPCACYIKGKLNGFTAMAGERGSRAQNQDSRDAKRLERGPAYSSDLQAPASSLSSSSAWPTYRHDAARSGSTSATVTHDLKRVWRSELGGKLSSVTVADEKVFVCQRDRNTVMALDARSGKVVWRYLTPATVDSPPTWHQGRAYFGCADGYVYCMRGSDGELCWRFRAAPEERRVMAFGRLESTWPVHGSVLIEDSAVVCAAGRSSFLDGGIHLVKLDAETGRLLKSAVVYDLDKEGNQPPLEGSFDMQGSLPDILSSDGESVFMRHRAFNRRSLKPTAQTTHMFSPAGFLDDTWWHRIYWVYGPDTTAGYGNWWRAGNRLPAGRILVNDDQAVYGYGRSYYPGMNSAQFSRGERYQMFASSKSHGAEPDYTEANQLRRQGRDIEVDWSDRRTVDFRWARESPFQVRSLILAGKTLFAAGPYGDGVHSIDAYEGRQGIRLAAISTEDGRLMKSFEINVMPVFDGMAAAEGRLYQAMQDGSVQSFGTTGEPLPTAANNTVEWMEEDLLETDAVEAEEVRSLRRQNTTAGVSRRPLTGTSLANQFARVANGRVVKSPLGYRVGAEAQQTALALKKLDRPVTERVTWKVTLRPATGFPHPPYYQNGFIAFGDGLQDEELIKCGVQFVRGTAVIIQGDTSGGKRTQQELAVAPALPVKVTVTVDLDQQEVELHVEGRSIRTKFAKRLDRITMVGFTAWNSVTDFTEID